VTAIAKRRARRTIIGVTAAVLLVALAATMFTVGVVTLSNSQEGEAVGVDIRPREQFPSTPNAVVAVTDESGRLASLVVMTLLPQGQGGSVVTVPVNADISAGFGSERQPIDESFDATDLEGLTASVEEMLSITVQRASVVDAAGLEAMLPQTDALQFDLPNDVVDSAGGGGLISTAGPQTFTSTEMVSLLVAIDDDAGSDLSHPNDVAVWESLAQTAPDTQSPEPVPTDDVGRPVAPATVDELVDRLWQGDVTVRDLSTLPADAVENPTQADVVVIDRRDSTLVFAQVSPGLVSTPNTGLKVRIVANFTDEELAGANGQYDSTSDLLVELIGRLVFLSGDVISVDSAPTGAPAVTIIEVADERQLQETIDAADALLGEADVRVAETVIEGVDVQVTLGTSYLEHELTRAGAVIGATVESTPPEVPSSTDVADTVPENG